MCARPTRTATVDRFRSVGSPPRPPGSGHLNRPIQPDPVIRSARPPCGPRRLRLRLDHGQSHPRLHPSRRVECRVRLSPTLLLDGRPSGGRPPPRGVRGPRARPDGVGQTHPRGPPGRGVPLGGSRGHRPRDPRRRGRRALPGVGPRPRRRHRPRADPPGSADRPRRLRPGAPQSGLARRRGGLRRRRGDPPGGPPPVAVDGGLRARVRPGPGRRAAGARRLRQDDGGGRFRAVPRRPGGARPGAGRPRSRRHERHRPHERPVLRRLPPDDRRVGSATTTSESSATPR